MCIFENIFCDKLYSNLVYEIFIKMYIICTPRNNLFLNTYFSLAYSLCFLFKPDNKSVILEKLAFFTVNVICYFINKFLIFSPF